MCRFRSVDLCTGCKYLKKEKDLYLCTVSGCKTVPAFGLYKKVYNASWIPYKCTRLRKETNNGNNS